MATSTEGRRASLNFMRGFCTIVTRSYFKYATALAASLQRHHPAAKLCVLVIDSATCPAASAASHVELFCIDEVRIPNIEDMKIYFNAFEISNCLKPFFVAHLLRRGFDEIVYLDTDILVVNPLDDAFDMLAKNTFILSPHWLRPELTQESDVTARNIVDLGIYNGGLWGVSKGGLAIMEWLMRLLPEFGFDDRQNGMFVDQKLLPLAAQLFSAQFGCIQHPGYNVAYWNLHEREITKSAGQYLVNGVPAVFFHLSGFRAEEPHLFSRHSSWTFERLPVLKEIVAEYLAAIPAEPLIHGPYAFDRAGSRQLSPELRRYFFHHRTFDGYQMVRVKSRIRRRLGF
jgi:hypothetical protein